VDTEMNSADCLLGKVKRKRFMGPQGALIVYLLPCKQNLREAVNDRFEISVAGDSSQRSWKPATARVAGDSVLYHSLSKPSSLSVRVWSPRSPLMDALRLGLACVASEDTQNKTRLIPEPRKTARSLD